MWLKGKTINNNCNRLLGLAINSTCNYFLIKNIFYTICRLHLYQNKNETKVGFIHGIETSTCILHVVYMLEENLKRCLLSFASVLGELTG